MTCISGFSLYPFPNFFYFPWGVCLLSFTVLLSEVAMDIGCPLNRDVEGREGGGGAGRSGNQSKITCCRETNSFKQNQLQLS